MFRRIFPRSVLLEKKKVIVVSGLPRSGTSMMMKILSVGGLPIVVDNQRLADEDNPHGYFEIELSKGLREGETNWVYNSQGKAVKVISYLLEFLPDDLSYDVIFMERELGEVLASQKKMLQHRNTTSVISDSEMKEQFLNHVNAVKYWIARKPNMRVLYVSYNQMMNHPMVFCTSIVEFLGLSLNTDLMQSIPNHADYRNRS